MAIRKTGDVGHKFREDNNSGRNLLEFDAIETKKQNARLLDGLVRNPNDPVLAERCPMLFEVNESSDEVQREFYAAWLEFLERHGVRIPESGEFTQQSREWPIVTLFRKLVILNPELDWRQGHCWDEALKYLIELDAPEVKLLSSGPASAKASDPQEDISDIERRVRSDYGELSAHCWNTALQNWREVWNFRPSREQLFALIEFFERTRLMVSDLRNFDKARVALVTKGVFPKTLLTRTEQLNLEYDAQLDEIEKKYGDSRQGLAAARKLNRNFETLKYLGGVENVRNAWVETTEREFQVQFTNDQLQALGREMNAQGFDGRETDAWEVCKRNLVARGVLPREFGTKMPLKFAPGGKRLTEQEWFELTGQQA